MADTEEAPETVEGGALATEVVEVKTAQAEASVQAKQKKPRTEAQKAQFEAARQKAYDLRKQYSEAKKKATTAAVVEAIESGSLKRSKEKPKQVEEAPKQVEEEIAESEEIEEEEVQITRRPKERKKKRVSRRKIVVVEQSSSSSEESDVEVVLPKRKPPQDSMALMTARMFAL